MKNNMNYPRFTTLFILCLCVLFTTHLWAQGNHVVWATLSATGQINDKASLTIKPIFRIGNNMPRYENTSIDISLQYKLPKGFSAQVLGRSWFIPNQRLRQFLWFSVKHTQRFGRLSWQNNLHYHGALDINDRVDPDFIRFKSTLQLSWKYKLTPLLAIEPWWRLNGQNSFQRIRYEPGIKWAFAKPYSLLLMYRREDSINLTPARRINMYVIVLSYTPK